MAKIQSRKTNHPFIIGLFVIIGSLVIVGGIIWLGAGKFFKERELYVTYFEGSVEGISIGSPVKYQGVAVGTVADISIAPDGRLIEVVMELSQRVHISDSIRVTTELAGLAGNKFLQLYFPELQSLSATFPVLEFVPPYPVIQSTPSGIEEITTAAREVINNLRMLQVEKISHETLKLLENTNTFFANKDLYDIVNNLEATSRQLKTLVDNAIATGTLESIGRSSQNLELASEDMTKFTANLITQLDDLRLTEHVDQAFAKYDSTMAMTGNVINRVGYRTESLMYSLNRIIEDISVTNRELRKALRTISDNPSAIFLTEPPPED